MQNDIPIKRKLLIILTAQFGYHTDTYMYCKYLDKTKYDVHYIGFDEGQLRREIEDVKVYYIPVHSNKILRYWIYLKTINRLIRKENFDILFQVDCQGSLLIRLCNIFRKSILDVRTGDVWMDKKNFSVYDSKVYLTSLFFKRITIISINLATKMSLPIQKCHYLPLGGDLMLSKPRLFESLRLFYIGTIHGRNFQQTITGLSLFLAANPSIGIQYDIVGYGTDTDEKELLSSIEFSNLHDIVKFHGRKNHDEIKWIFDNANIGVVYVPITKGYTCQPTTKLYEYLLSGMPVIATNTLENKLAMTPEAGVLIDDNPEDFAKGLEIFWNQRETFNSERIKELYKASTWENIVMHNLEPYFDSL